MAIAVGRRRAGDSPVRFGDVLNVVLSISEIAIGTVGTFFWAALVVLYLEAVVG